ncbi:MAG: hypothetical protein IRZ16_06390 [Myxococcaceae bacterium]|nr:hypothetical protein [Myxococcaceae bacterium]
MHPTLARYLDPETARAALLLAESGDPVPEEHRHMVAAAQANPKERRLVTKAGRTLDTKAQQAVLFLATFAALHALQEEAGTRPTLERARAKLAELGASPEEIDAMLAQAVADEAFGTDQDPGHFDTRWFEETLGDLPKLAALQEDEVLALIRSFVKTAPQGDAMLYENAARQLLKAAWSDGASPITAENMEDALDALSEQYDGEDFERAALALAKFIETMQEQKLIGPMRAERLTAIARAAAAAGIEDEDEADDEESDEEDEAP